MNKTTKNQILQILRYKRRIQQRVKRHNKELYKSSFLNGLSRGYIIAINEVIEQINRMYNEYEITEK